MSSILKENFLCTLIPIQLFFFFFLRFFFSLSLSLSLVILHSSSLGVSHLAFHDRCSSVCGVVGVTGGEWPCTEVDPRQAEETMWGSIMLAE